MDYYHKYIKYKIKYTNLKKQFGGNGEKNILFACTTLHTDSTLSKNFDVINQKINELLGGNSGGLKKNTYIVYNKTGYEKFDIFAIDNDLMKKLESNNYNIKKSYFDIRFIHVKDLVNFLREMTMRQGMNISFDILVLTQCNNLVTTITGDEKQNIDKDTEKYVMDNMLIFYNSLSENGYLINYYYNEKDEMVPLNVDQYYSSYLYSFKSHIALSYCFNELFTNIGPGIYHKNKNNATEAYKIIAKSFKKTDDEIIEIINSNTKDNICNAIINKYFTNIYERKIYINIICNAINRYLTNNKYI